MLDAECIAQIDSTGEEALGHLVDELHEDGVSLAVARMRTELQASLDDAGLAAQIGADRFYPTVRAAVQACATEAKTDGESIKA